MHVYQQKLDALQPKAAAADAGPDAGLADSGIGAAPAAPADSSLGEASAALQLELARLEQQLCVEDILLCRSLAELALERRSSSSGERLGGCGGVLLCLCNYTLLDAGTQPNQHFSALSACCL